MLVSSGGFSGGRLQRPALRDLAAGRIDIIVVYKIDRLNRSLADFAKLIETLDAHHVSFMAVTQQFNTSTSSGRQRSLPRHPPHDLQDPTYRRLIAHRGTTYSRDHEAIVDKAYSVSFRRPSRSSGLVMLPVPSTPRLPCSRACSSMLPVIGFCPPTAGRVRPVTAIAHPRPF